MAIPLEQRLRTLRILHVVFLATILLYALLPEVLSRQDGNITQTHRIFLVVLMSQIGLVTFLRVRIVSAQAELIARNPNDQAALRRWQSGQIVTFAVCQSIGLLGFALRFMGGEILQAVPFYAVAFALMLFFAPRNPVQ